MKHEIITCDGCGKVADIVKGELLPHGWLQFGMYGYNQTSTAEVCSVECAEKAGAAMAKQFFIETNSKGE